MCIVCQTAMTVAAAVTAVVPGVGATQQSEPERPVAAVAAAPSLKGKCARVGQSRTVKGVRYVCSASKRWQVATGGGSGTVTTTVAPTTTTTLPPTTSDPLKNEYDAFTKTLPRFVGDRPDDRSEPAQVKMIYVVPKFATDRSRDTSGELSRYAFEANEWFASQNGGFGLRFDTYQGALDVGFLSLDLTKDQWYDLFTPTDGYRHSLAPMQEHLKKAGYPITVVKDPFSGDPAAPEKRKNKLYMLFYEAPRGTYSRTGAGFGQCWPTIDALDVALGGKALTNDNGASCGTLDSGRMKSSWSALAMSQWVSRMNPMFDHPLQFMRKLPGCGSPRTPKDGERVKIPGVIDESRAWEIRGGFMRDLAEPNDPLADAFHGGRWNGKFPKIDDRNDLYFHITSDKLASEGACNSDTSKHPLWDNLPLDRDSGRTLQRSSYDRPDDIAGAQFHAVYVLRYGATDYAYDTGGEIERALRHADRWLRTESGKGMRLDTYQGKLDITFLPLPPRFESTTGKSCSSAPCPNDQDFYAHLNALGRVNPNKTYLFFYSGGVTGRVLCGGAGVGKSVLLNLEVDGRMCGDQKWDESTSQSLSWGLLSLHEIFHSLGAVCPAAPDSDGAYHSKVEEDIMFARSKGNVKLDPNRRNYWGNVPAGCTDASQSPLFGG
ncbi:MAG: hypothetical protein ACO3Z0_05155 [Ilumatobacteraceae bacterium]